jgi:hypothetical protein
MSLKIYFGPENMSFPAMRVLRWARPVANCGGFFTLKKRSHLSKVKCKTKRIGFQEIGRQEIIGGV